MISLQKASPEDTDLMFSWQSNPKTRTYFRDSSIPSYLEHCDWMEKTLTRNDVYLYTIVYKKRKVGCIRLDLSGLNRAAVSILLSPEEYGNGFAYSALDAALKKHRNLEFEAYIDVENSASQKLFKKCGFAQVDETTYIKGAECE